MAGSFLTSDLAMMFDTDVFAETVTYTPSGGSAVSIPAIFDLPFEEMAVQETGVDSAAPQCAVRSADAPSAKPGDTVQRGATVYNVISAQPDGTGVTTLVLSED